jgi:hypothetical protein
VKTVFLIVASLFLASCAGAVWWIAGVTHQAVADADQAIVHLDKQITSAGVVIADAQNAVNLVSEAEVRQSKYWDQTARQTAGTVKALRLLIDRTDHSLNDQTLPAANVLLKEADSWLALTNDDADKLTVAANATLDAGTHAFDLLGMRIGDQRLDDGMDHLNLLALHLDDTSESLSEMMADTAHEVHKFVYPPPRKWWQRYFTDPGKVAARLITIPIR